MGKITSALTFTGSVGNITAYQSGNGSVIIQKKGGPSRHKIKTSPAYAILRRHNAEFGGRAVASKWMMRALWPLKTVANYNIAGPLNRLMKSIQEKDTISEFGKRHVLLSAQPHLAEGFQLNTKTILESVLRAPFSFSISRQERSATILIPELVPGINFVVPDQYPWYRIIAVLGVVPDLFSTEHGYKPSYEVYTRLSAKQTATPWMLSAKLLQETLLEVKIDDPLPDNHHTLMLSVGVLFGKTGIAENPEQVAHAGSAKILSATV